MEEVETLASGTRIKIEGQVYCLSHCVVHDDTTDPYGYGKRDCRRVDHRKIYWSSRKGDLL